MLNKSRRTSNKHLKHFPANVPLVTQPNVLLKMTHKFLWCHLDTEGRRWLFWGSYNMYMYMCLGSVYSFDWWKYGKAIRTSQVKLLLKAIQMNINLFLKCNSCPCWLISELKTLTESNQLIDSSRDLNHHVIIIVRTIKQNLHEISS